MNSKTVGLLRQLTGVIAKKPECYQDICMSGVFREVVECMEQEMEILQPEQEICEEIKAGCAALLQEGTSCEECIQVLKTLEQKLCISGICALQTEDYDCKYLQTGDHRSEWFEYLLPSFWWSHSYEYGWAGKFCHQGGVVLDAACGIPHPLKFFLEGRAEKVYACDLDEKITDKAAVMAEIADLPDITEYEMEELSQKYDRIEFSRQDLTCMGYQDEMFDTVFCVSVIEHMDTESQTSALQEFYRILKSGGKMVLTMDIPSVNLVEFLVTAQQTGFRFMGQVSTERPEDAVYSEQYNIYCYRIVMQKETQEEKQTRQQLLDDVQYFCEHAKMLRNSANCAKYYKGKYSENECNQALYYLQRKRITGAYVFGADQEPQQFMRQYILEKYTDITSESKIMEVGPGNLPLFEEKDYPNWYGCDINYDNQADEIHFEDKVWGKSKYSKVFQGSWENVDEVCEKNDLGNQFDLICGSHSFEHCTKPITALVNAAKVLKKGGKIVLFVPDGYSNWGGNYDCTHYLYMVEDMALEFFQYAGGYKNVECRQFRRNMDLVITAEKI